MNRPYELLLALMMWRNSVTFISPLSRNAVIVGQVTSQLSMMGISSSSSTSDFTAEYGRLEVVDFLTFSVL